MRRKFLIVILALAILLIITAATAWFLIHNESFLKSQLSSIAFKQTGRELSVNGPLRLDLGRESTIEAHDIHFQNAAWTKSPDMVTVGRLLLKIDLPSLFGETRIIPVVEIEDCNIELLRNVAGEANWDVLPEPESVPEPSPARESLPVIVQNLKVQKCRFGLDGPKREHPLKIEIDEFTTEIDNDDHVRTQGVGLVNEESFSFSGWYGPYGVFYLGGPVEHEFRWEHGNLKLQSSGSLDDAATLTGANINAEMHGPEIGAILENLSLPAISEGPFDFRIGLITSDGLTKLDLNGDLGSLDITARGELDSLLKPSTGHINGTVNGPDLEALGQAFKVNGLVADPYDLVVDTSFEEGLIHFKKVVLKTSADEIGVMGDLGTGEGLAGTVLDVHLESEEIGRWTTLLNRPSETVGQLSLEGQLISDISGLFSVRASVAQNENTLELDGALGTLAGPFEPDLDIVIQSPNPQPLAALFGQDNVPAAPLEVQGHVRMRAKQVEFEGVALELAGARAHIDGQLSLQEQYSGSELKVSLDVRDMAELGHLFGKDNLPAAPIESSGHFLVENNQVKLTSVKLDLNGDQAQINGHVSLAEKYSGSEIEVALDIKNLADLGRSFGFSDLPAQPLKLSSVIEPEGNGLSFRVSDGHLGEISLTLDGSIADLQIPLGIDANFDIRLPSLKALSFLQLDATLPDQPFTASGSLHNEDKTTRLDRVQLTLGSIEAGVNGEVFHDQRFNLAIAVEGPDASVLQEWVPKPLKANPFSLKVQLTGNPSKFKLSNLTAHHGKNQLAGDLEIGLGERTSVSGQVASSFMDLSNWNAEEEEETESTEPQAEFVFDDTPAMAIGDLGIDLQLDVKVDHLDLGNTLVEDLHIGVILLKDYLELNPFTARGRKGGTTQGTVVLDGRGSSPEMNINLHGTDVRIGLAAVKGQDPSTFPPIEYELVMHGIGATQREMVSGLNGRLRAYGGAGQMPAAGVSLLFSDFLTELFSLLNPFAKTSEYTQIDCSVAAADIVSGQVEIYPVIFQTEQMTILSQGAVDLDNETLDLSFNTKPRQGLGLSAGVLINPFIKVGGNLAAPTILLDPERALISGSVAVATVGLSLLAKSVSDRFLSSKDPCGDARKEIEKRDSASP